MEVMIERAHVQIRQSVKDWREAVSLAVTPLVQSGHVEERYIQGIYDNTEKYGPYYVIAPLIALPHARPEQGVKQQGFSVLLLNEAVKFSQTSHEVKLVIGFAATDSESHLQSLMSLSEILTDDEKLNLILQASTEEELYQFFQLID